MWKTRGLLIALSLVVAALVLGALYTAFSVNNKDLKEIAKTTNPEEIQQNPTDNEIWGKYYPSHWKSYLKGKESDTSAGDAGNAKISKLERFPYLKILYKGIGFSEEFWEPRGHPHAVQDVTSVPGSRTKTGGACLTCKSPDVPGLIEKYGDKFYSAPFDQMVKEVKHPIGCYDCHDPKTNELRISRPALIKAYERQGKDITKASKQEMRSLVCAQCHVTYYFLDETKEVTFPWDKGLKADQVYQYFQEKNYSEWEHPISKTGLPKSRHPDYEFYQGSTHERAGVSCADCHMPYVKVDGRKISSHWWVSPLENAEVSCAPCHTQGAEFQKERVRSIQDQHNEVLEVAAQANVKAIETIEKALKNPDTDSNLLKEAQELHRKAFWYFDWISTSNSMGFHNPQEGAKFLTLSTQWANEAIQKAEAAMGAKP